MGASLHQLYRGFSQRLFSQNPGRFAVVLGAERVIWTRGVAMMQNAQAIPAREQGLDHACSRERVGG